MTESDFKEKFIAYIDILGFKKLVSASERGTGMSIDEILGLAKELGTPEDRMKFIKYGPMTCPTSKYVQRDLDFRLIQISDCVIVSVEVSPAGVINLVKHCWSAVIKLLDKGFMCRGYITRGLIYHTDTQVIGTGYQEAYQKESNVTAFGHKADERGTPFVEVDSAVCDYVRVHGDSCVKEMFSRFVKEDGTVTAIFPFQRLQHSFIIGDYPGHKFDPEEERESNRNIMSMIENMKIRVMSFVDLANSDALAKVSHYITALDTQLDACKEADRMIDILESPFP
jgi:hypothetical protein